MFSKELIMNLYFQKMSPNNNIGILGKIIPKNIYFFILGILAGSQIEIYNGLYLAHFVILLLIIFNVKFNKIDTYLYLIFIILCVLSLLYNYLIYDSSNFRITNFFNSIFLFSVILINIDLQDFKYLFKGYFIFFITHLVIVLSKFDLSLLNNGFFLFFTKEREWMDGYSFFGNSFAILGIILNYINYKLYNKNLFIFLLISIILIMTTSRLSFFGLLIGLTILFKNYLFKFKVLKILFFICLPILLFQIIQFNFDEIDGFEIISNRITYADDRSNLAEITKMLFYKHPLIGNGPIYIEKYTLWEPHLHNIWFDIVVGYGIFSLIVYITLFTLKIRSYLLLTKDYLFIFFIFLSSISQISLKEPYIGLILFSYLNLFKKK